jgi:hypothetical protein
VFHTLLPHSLNLRDLVSPQIGLLGGLWEVISLPSVSQRQPVIWTWVLTSLMAMLPSPCWFLHLTPTPQEDESLLWTSCPLTPGGISCPVGLGDPPQPQGRWKTTLSTILDKPSKDVMGNLNRDRGLWGKEAMFYCACTDSADLCPKAEPWEQRSVTFCTLASWLQGQ